MDGNVTLRRLGPALLPAFLPYLLPEAARAVAILGGRIQGIHAYTLGDAVHRVVVIRKEKPTPLKYPRRFAKIKQQPL